MAFISHIQSPLSWWKRQKKGVKALTILVLAIVLFVVFGKGGTDANENIETVSRQNLSRTVLASGTVVSSTDLSMSFEAPKMVGEVKVKVGETVKKGDILAVQKNGSERGAYNAAQGTLLAAEARYNGVLDGSSNEEIALAQLALNNAKRDLELVKKVQDGLVENARRRLNSEGLVAEPRNSSTSVIPTITGTYTGPEGEYRITPDLTSNRELKITGIEKTTAQISESISKPLGTKGLYIVFSTDDVISNREGWVVLIPNTKSSSYVANSTSYIAAKNTRDAAIASAESVVLQNEAELNLKRATARPSELDAALADIVSARAQVEQANALLEKTILRAPTDGTITKVSIKPGETPEAMQEAIVLQDISNLYLEADVNESQISDVFIGQNARVTLDALDGKTFDATISSVDPAATITENIVNYKIKALLSDITNIRPGMTADISIETKKVSNVLVLPMRAVTLKDGGYVVEKIIDLRRKKTTLVPVTLGIKGDGDLVEILSGLNEGDKVLWNTNNE